MGKGAHWYGLNMLPLYIDIVDGKLEGSLQKLDGLEQSFSALDVNELERSFRFYSLQRTDNWVFFEQCKKWRNENPDDAQLQLISQVEKSAHQLDVVNKRILILINQLRNKKPTVSDKLPI